MALTVALFRPRADALATAAALAERGLAAAFAPVTEIAATGAAPPPGLFDYAVASSAHALALATPETLAAARELPLHVVGAKTAAAAARAGLVAATSAADVATLLPTLPPGRALYLAGRDRKPDLEAALGDRVAVVVVYEARERSRWSAEEAAGVAEAPAALHYSERSAALAAAFAEAAGLGQAFRRKLHVCLSRQVAAPLAALGVKRAFWPQRPAQEPLLDALESALADYASGRP
jgi:uroporphyrinogen-III synthase